MKYYSATKERNTFENHVPAPYIRKSFKIDSLKEQYSLIISVVGIYELSVNGKVIDKGKLLPYRTNPNHVVYYDTYRLNDYLVEGENVIGVMLGNGFGNSIMRCWDFDKLSWAHAPKIALEVKKGDETIFDMSQFVCHPSEVVFDDFHCGEHIDANKSIKDWNKPGFDDSKWNKMIEVESPKGELLPHPSFYPTVYEETKPVNVIKGPEGYIYDFGMSFAGTYQIKIKGEKGKTIRLFMNDAITSDKTIFLPSIVCLGGNLPLEYIQFDWLTLSGELDTFISRFSYKAGRFIELKGLSDEEAKTVEIVAYKVSSIPNVTSHFKCDNETINKLQEITINSDISNFFYFPTDCPHREKNGWTGDAALSAEQMLINFSCGEQLKTWYKNIIKAQNKEGTIPGIVPTDTWGFAWGNGPSWDTILFELPYRVYLYTSDKEILELAKEPIIKYLKYQKTKENEKGLYNYGLGDWLPAKQHTPIEAIDTMVCKHHCDLASKIFEILGEDQLAKETKDYSKRIKKNYALAYPIDFDFRCYTQAMAFMGIYYDMYEEKERAVRTLMYILKSSNYHMEFGVIANRVAWRLLAELGQTDLAIEMMTRDDFFSFKTWLNQGATTLFEAFVPFDETVLGLDKNMFDGNKSMNHHFWGDISAFYYRHLAGLQINGYKKFTFAPSFSKYVKHIEADMMGFEVRISHIHETIEVELNIPKGYELELKVPDGYVSSSKKLKEGLNRLSFEKVN